MIKEKVLKLVCTEFISVNHYMNYRVAKIKNKHTGKMFNTVQPYKPKETQKFEREFSSYVKEEVIKQGWIKPEKGKFIFLDTVFYFPRTDMDDQNYFKSMCDIMTDCGIWEDDNIVIVRNNRIYYDKENPRIEINITETPFTGIFDSREDYECFLNKCVTCNRHKRNCSILKNATESRIQTEVVRESKGWRCNKYKEIKK